MSFSRWQIKSDDPHGLPLSADARLSPTDFRDDQTWRLSLGGAGSRAIALQTRYGGRTGLASLVPMWHIDGQLRYLQEDFTQPPTIVHFAPGFMQLEAQLIPHLDLRAHFLALESQVCGGDFALTNTGSAPLELLFELFAHVAAEGAEQPLAIVSLRDGLDALSLGAVGDLQPVVVMDAATASPETGSPKVASSLAIAPGTTVSVRWVHAGLPDLRDSLRLAMSWLSRDWQEQVRTHEQAAAHMPVITTGEDACDLAIALSLHRITSAFVSHPALPAPVLSPWRLPDHGYHPRVGQPEQDPLLAYLVASIAASVDARLGQGIVENYLSAQSEDGSIALRAPTGTPAPTLLCTPLLARITWDVYLQTEDRDFVARVYPGLCRFFGRWLQQDADGDNLPEWEDERQTGYVAMPTFGVAREWGQGLDICTVESPDMAAYLISEAGSLRAMAELLDDADGLQNWDARLESLQSLLMSLWDGERFTYRDRDSHAVSTAQTLLADGAGDADHVLNAALDPPARLIVRVVGGLSHTPSASLLIEGRDAAGKPVKETATAKDFLWHRGQGLYTSRQVFAQLERLKFDGLSRVYRVSVTTPDLTGLDISGLLPLWTGDLPDEQRSSLVRMATSKNHFRRPNGLTMISADDPHFDPSNANGAGGVWPYWLTLVAEGLIAAGEPREAAAILRTLLSLQADLLARDGQFYAFYHSDEAQGLGQGDLLDGVVPLRLLTQLIGVRIVSSGKVWTGGPFGWGRTVTLQQYGVHVRRTTRSITIDFPSGHQVKLDKDAPWQAVEDPQPTPMPSIAPPDAPDRPAGPPSGKIQIDVELDE